MTTGIVRPDQDYNCNWKGPHSANIDDPVTQPATGDLLICECDAKNDGLIEEFGMSTLSNVVANSVSQIIVWIYGRAESANQADLDIYFGGGYETAQLCTLPSSNGWRSYTFGGLAGSQADLDALRVRFTAAPTVGNGDEMFIDVVYAEVTYTEDAPAEMYSGRGIGRGITRGVIR